MPTHLAPQLTHHDKLHEILANTQAEVASRIHAADLAQLERQALAHTPRGFLANLRRVASTGPAIIAEIKKASPSKGLIRADFHPSRHAAAFQAAGAAALSILTDSRFFQGSLSDLAAASAAVSIPCLRKDFIVDPFQILEARAHGADAILLIVAAHDDTSLDLLARRARELDLDVLCEAHNREEIARASSLGFNLIGVNSRDLRSFSVDTQSLLDLHALLPPQALHVAESGIHSHEDVARLRAAGYHAFLVGEALMRQPDPGAALALLLNRNPDHNPDREI